MNSRMFLAGAVCGALTVAVIDWFLFEDRRALPDDAKSMGVESNLRSSADSDETRGSQSNDIPYADGPGVSDRSENSPPDGRGNNTPTTRGQFRPRSDAAIRESGRQDPAERDTRYWLQKRRDELSAEPKDDSWAYYMEQTLSQFLTSHPAITEFDVSYVECRTTICQIQVIGFDESTSPTWSRIMYDLRQVLPEQTKEWGTSGYDLEGRYAIVQTIRRGE